VHPGVVIVHDVFGMTADLRSQADWLAAAGFLAVAPNLFSHAGKISCVRKAFQDLSQRRGRTFEDVETVRVWVASEPRCSGRVGIIGFCMGGGFALLLAPRGGYSAASVNYGQVPEDAEEFLGRSCPLVGSFGGRDRTLKGAGQRLTTVLTRLEIPHDVKEDPSANHGFMNRHSGILPMIMARVGGIGYEGVAAADARQRIAAFFRQHLRVEPPTS